MNNFIYEKLNVLSEEICHDIIEIFNKNTNTDNIIQEVIIQKETNIRLHNLISSELNKHIQLYIKNTESINYDNTTQHMFKHDNILINQYLTIKKYKKNEDFQKYTNTFTISENSMSVLNFIIYLHYFLNLLFIIILYHYHIIN